MSSHLEIKVVRERTTNVLKFALLFNGLILTYLIYSFLPLQVFFVLGVLVVLNLSIYKLLESDIKLHGLKLLQSERPIVSEMEDLFSLQLMDVLTFFAPDFVRYAIHGQTSLKSKLITLVKSYGPELAKTYCILILIRKIIKNFEPRLKKLKSPHVFVLAMTLIATKYSFLIAKRQTINVQ